MSGNEHEPAGQPGGWDGAACQQLREDAAVAVLTRRPLPPQVQEHARVCPPCADELAELASLGPLLEVARDAAVPPERPSDLMLPRLLSQVSARRRRRRWAIALVAAAAVAAAVPVGIAVGRSQRPQVSAGRAAPSTPAPGVVSTASGGGPTGGAVGPTAGSRTSAPAAFSTGEGVDGTTGAEVDVEVSGRAWGSSVLVSVKNMPTGTPCRLVVVDAVGRSVEGGSWTVPEAASEQYQRFAETVMTKPQDVAVVRLVDNRTNRVMVAVRMVRA